MERKLIKQGVGGYTIYLPKRWITARRLESGDTVDVTETETAVIVRAAAKGPETTTIALASQEHADAVPFLTHAYRRGFERIVFTGTDEKTANALRRAAHEQLIGFDVTDVTPTSITVESVSEPTDEKTEPVLRRAFLLILEAAELVVRAGDEGFVHMQRMDEIRTQHDKYTLYSRRATLRAEKEQNPTLQWELLTFVMHIMHALYYLYRYGAERNVKPTQRYRTIAHVVNEHARHFNSAYWQRSRAAISAIERARKDAVFDGAYALLRETRGDETVLVMHAREVLRLIQIGTSPIRAQLLEEGFRERGQRTA